MSSDEQTVRAAVVIVLAPLDSGDGKGVGEAVERAVSETAAGIEGWNVETRLVDDDVEDVGELAREIVNDDVVAVIGGLSTDTIRAVQPVFDAASLLFVSPADTVPEHTRGADPGNVLRPYASYYRTSVSSEQPMQALGRHAIGALDIGRVATIDAGGGAADIGPFAEAVTEGGGEVVDVGGEKPGDALTPADAGSMISTATDADAEAVFVAGRSGIAAAVADAAATANLTLLGGSALTTEDFLAEAGSSADGAFTAVAGELMPDDGPGLGASAEQMAEVGVTSPGRHGAEAYDAGLAVGTVLTRCLPPASSAISAREGCTGEMAQVSVTGVTGEVAFDAFGDRAGTSPMIMVVRSGTLRKLDSS